MPTPSTVSGTQDYFLDGLPYLPLYDSSKDHGDMSWYFDGMPYVPLWGSGTPPASTPAPFLLLLGVGS